jgi:hypothetical protein
MFPRFLLFQYKFPSYIPAKQINTKSGFGPDARLPQMSGGALRLKGADFSPATVSAMWRLDQARALDWPLGFAANRRYSLAECQSGRGLRVGINADSPIFCSRLRLSPRMMRMPTPVAARNARPPCRRAAFTITSTTVIRTICRAGPGRNELQRSTPGITALLARNERTPATPHIRAFSQLRRALPPSRALFPTAQPTLEGMGARLAPPMTLGNMRENDVRSLAIYCWICHHEAVLSADGSERASPDGNGPSVISVPGRLGVDHVERTTACIGQVPGDRPRVGALLPDNDQPPRFASHDGWRIFVVTGSGAVGTPNQ